MTCHTTWTTAHSSFPASPRQYSYDISWYTLLLFTTAFPTRQAHSYTSVLSKNAGQLQLQIHWRSAYKREEMQHTRCAAPGLGKMSNGHYRCGRTAAVVAGRTWFGVLKGHRIMGQRTTQGGTREAGINVISGSPNRVSQRLLPLPSTNKPVPAIASHVPQFSASQARTVENKELVTDDL